MKANKSLIFQLSLLSMIFTLGTIQGCNPADIDPEEGKTGQPRSADNSSQPLKDGTSSSGTYTEFNKYLHPLYGPGLVNKNMHYSIDIQQDPDTQKHEAHIVIRAAKGDCDD